MRVYRSKKTSNVSNVLMEPESRGHTNELKHHTPCNTRLKNGDDSKVARERQDSQRLDRRPRAWAGVSPHVTDPSVFSSRRGCLALAAPPHSTPRLLPLFAALLTYKLLHSTNEVPGGEDRITR